MPLLRPAVRAFEGSSGGRALDVGREEGRLTHSMPRWTIRPAEGADAEALARCIDRAYAVYKDQIGDLPAVSDDVAGDIASNIVWVAELDDDVVGGLILVPDEKFAILANVAVDPAVGGQGLGQALIEQAEAECRDLGLSELRLSTHKNMPKNVALYQRLGWAETERSGAKVRMSKRL